VLVELPISLFSHEQISVMKFHNRKQSRLNGSLKFIGIKLVVDYLDEILVGSVSSKEEKNAKM